MVKFPAREPVSDFFNRRTRTLADFLKVRNSRFGDFVGGITAPWATLGSFQ
jgi:hypothetical protein